MPTFTTITLDRFIEPKASKPMAAGKNVSDSRQGSGINGTDRQPELRNSTKSIDRKHHWTQISPALYATPDPSPLPDSPSLLPPSPYVIDHKRRGPRLLKTFSDHDAALRQGLTDEKTDEIVRSLEAEDVRSCSVVKMQDNASGAITMFNGELGNDNIHSDYVAEQENSNSVMLEQDSEKDDFFDPQDSSSVRSIADRESNYGLERSLNLNASSSEFYDAWEELSSESGSQAPLNEIETELREIRLSLLMEMEKKKQAEDHINDIRSQWGRIREQLSLAGLNLPADPTMLEDQPADDLVEELSRQLYLIRFVSNAIGRGVAKAETEAEMEVQLESKNFEIARLLDRLRYYEAVNHEMSQRNQETIETMRRLRQRRKRRQRWIWGSIAAAIVLGSTALAWSYLPTGKESSSPDPSPSHASEGSHSDQ